MYKGGYERKERVRKRNQLATASASPSALQRKKLGKHEDVAKDKQGEWVQENY